jgi:peptidoglycan/xylan/chitin deacetylase (PgdA/CDA1 family)
MNKIAFSVDLDDWYHTPLVAGADFSHFPDVETFFESWSERFDYVTKPTYKLLDLLKSHDIRGTFFVIADMVDRYPELMKRLKESGHEIAHHSLHHTIPFRTKIKIQTQTKVEWESELQKAKEILEGYFSVPMAGFRAPGAYFADWMVPILINNGFLYDTSIVSNSVYNKSNRDLSGFPKTPFLLNSKFNETNESRGALVEIPWVSRKVGNFYLPGGGAYFFRIFGARYFRRMFNQHLKIGDGLFYIHSLDISDEKFPLSNFRNRPFYWINKGQKTFRALDSFLSSFKGQFCTCSELANKHLS